MRLLMVLHQDIANIQRCGTTVSFSVAIELFNKKYQLDATNNLVEFIDYFNQEWVRKHSGWYEGFIGPHAVCTNNGLESTNGVIKKKKHNAQAFIDSDFH